MLKRAEGTEHYADDADRLMTDIRSRLDVLLMGIAAGRAELIRLHREGSIEDEVLHELERDLDRGEMSVISPRGHMLR